MRAFVVAAVLVPLLGCQCGGSAVGVNDVDSGSGLRDGGAIGGGGGSGGGSGGGGGGSSSADGGRSAEVCDGLDNDLNGIIDDVDVGHDGVCDCLKIATLGFAGEWGTGDVFKNWLNGKSLAGAVELKGETLTASLLAPYQVIVVQDVRVGTAGQSGVGKGIGRTYSDAEVQVLKDWVQNGGGVMTLIGYGNSSEITNVNKLMAPFGVNYGSTQVLQGAQGSTKPVTHWVTHPISDGITKIGTDNGYEVQGGGTLVAYEATVGDVDAARALTVGQGHVFMWCDEWITYNSEWTQHPDYQVERFWLNSIKWLTPANQCQVEIPNIF